MEGVFELSFKVKRRLSLFLGVIMWCCQKMFALAPSLLREPKTASALLGVNVAFRVPTPQLPFLNFVQRSGRFDAGMP